MLGWISVGRQAQLLKKLDEIDALPVFTEVACA
jgi:hypothetical protein